MAEINSNKLLKIAITGPESTGKTELAKQLSIHYNSEFIPEYARTYVEKLNRPYNYLDVLHIAHKQIELEQELRASNGKYLFLDTELIITKVWLEVVYGNCPKWIDKAIRQSNIDLYLLCNLDIPWVEDSVRENGGEMRGKLFQIYEQLIIENGFKYKVIAGTGDLRLRNALVAIEQFVLTSHILEGEGKGI
jgi:NadR type nicotinamide-nucleotide adenylyltransferase